MNTPEHPADAPLDFSAPADSASAQNCVSCKQAIVDQYWTIGEAILCPSCKAALDQGRQVSTEVTARTGRFARALLYGVAGMIGGAVIWYAIAKLANLEIGLIAILLGWMVGKGVFAGSGRRGGRRYQVLAVVLTYMGIGLAYVPFAVEGMLKEDAATEIAKAPEAPAAEPAEATEQLAPEAPAPALPVTDSASPIADSSAADIRPSVGMSLLILAGVALAGIFTLPVLVTVNGGTGAFISVLIYGFALMEAWKLAREVQLPVQGPFQVGGPAAA